MEEYGGGEAVLQMHRDHVRAALTRAERRVRNERGGLEPALQVAPELRQGGRVEAHAESPGILEKEPGVCAHPGGGPAEPEPVADPAVRGLSPEQLVRDPLQLAARLRRVAETGHPRALALEGRHENASDAREVLGAVVRIGHRELAREPE